MRRTPRQSMGFEGDNPGPGDKRPNGEFEGAILLQTMGREQRVPWKSKPYMCTVPCRMWFVRLIASSVLEISFLSVLRTCGPANSHGYRSGATHLEFYVANSLGHRSKIYHPRSKMYGTKKIFIFFIGMLRNSLGRSLSISACSVHLAIVSRRQRLPECGHGHLFGWWSNRNKSREIHRGCYQGLGTLHFFSQAQTYYSEAFKCSHVATGREYWHEILTRFSCTSDDST